HVRAARPLPTGNAPRGSAVRAVAPALGSRPGNRPVSLRAIRGSGGSVVGRFSRRRVLSGATLTLAIVLTIAAATTATAAPSRASSRWNHVAKPPTSGLTNSSDFGSEPQVSGPIWKTFHLFEVFSQRFTFVDVAPKGDSPGDYGVFKDPIETNGGVRIGTID